MNYFLVKSEPAVYPYQQLVRDKITTWNGVRNYTARKHLNAMNKGDAVLFFHSADEKAVIGIALVSKSAFPDPTDKEGKWTAVNLIPFKLLNNPVTLAQIKNEKKLADIGLIRIGRLSVMPLTKNEFDIIVGLSLHRT